jgi:hypothetical protein
LRKVTVSHVMSVCPYRTTRLPLDGFSWNLKFEYFSKRRKFKFHLKSDKNSGYFTGSPIHIFLSYLAQFFLGWEMFQTKVAEKIKTHIWNSVTFFSKSRRLWENVVKYCRAGQATDGNLSRVHCRLDTYDYKHTLIICNAYCFSTATVVAWTRVNVTLYVLVHYLTCKLTRMHAHFIWILHNHRCSSGSQVWTFLPADNIMPLRISNWPQILQCIFKQ